MLASNQTYPYDRIDVVYTRYNFYINEILESEKNIFGS
jgi:hypothetical protein